MLLKESIHNAVLSQKETLRKNENIIVRELSSKIKFQNKFAVIISGIRRCGKSTLMRSIAIKNKPFNYINFDDPRLTGFELADFERLEKVFMEVGGKAENYFFDEIQSVDKWEIYIRKLLEQNKYVVITGSNASLLSRELGTKLTGRNLRYELFPFSYAEFLLFSKKKEGISSFKEYLTEGGFPDYILLKEPRILHDLLIDSLYRDIAIRHKVRNVKELHDLAIFLVSNTSKEFSFNSLRKMFNIGSTGSVSKYISYFEESYLLFTLSKFDYSLKKQLVNPKKIYAVDNGLIAQNSKSFTDDLGRLLENAVFIGLKSKQKELFYFKDKNECDFVVKFGSGIGECYQVCYELNDFNKEREIAGLLEALDKFNLKEGYILTFEQEDEHVVDKKRVIIMPVWKWLLAQ
ncbi:MAG: ATP-binding protein [archaeon]